MTSQFTRSSLKDMNAIIPSHTSVGLDTIPEDSAGTVPTAPVQAGWLAGTPTPGSKSVAAESSRLSVISTTAGVIDEGVSSRQRRQQDAAGLLEEPPDEAPKTACKLPNQSWRMWLLETILATAVTVAIYFIVAAVENNKGSNNVGSTPGLGPPTVAPTLLTDDFFPTGSPSVAPTTGAPSESPPPSSAPSVNEDNQALIEFIDARVKAPTDAHLDALSWMLSQDSVRLSDGEDRVIQRYSLAVLYFSLGGPFWFTNSFLEPDLHECDWDGIHCTNGDTLFVEGITLSSANLSGEMVSENLELLPQLKGLFLYNNSIQGTMPESWWDSMPNLNWLDLAQNQLSGQVSSRIWDLPVLRILWIADNLLTGTIPPITSTGVRLLDIDASFNEFSGPFPASLWELRNLTYVYLNNNLITGTLPDFPTNTPSSLKAIWLQENRLEGPLPVNMAPLQKLEKVVLFRNEFSSSIPDSWFEMSSLSYLDISENSLAGMIPATLINATSLAYLYLNDNTLSGSLPAELPFSIKAAWFQDNELNGTIPQGFGEGYQNLSSLLLHGNMISGGVVEVCESKFIRLEADCANTSAPYYVPCDCCTKCY